MRKIWAFAFAACLALCCLAGCAGGNSTSASSSTDTASSSTAATESSASTSTASTSTASESTSASSASASTSSASASASASASSASASSASGITPAQDALVRHSTYLTDETADNYSEYVTVYYGTDSNALVGYVDETHFMKDAGYTKEALESADYEKVFPNLNSLNFAKVTVTDEGDYYCVMVTFTGLDEAANVKAFIDSGIFTPDDGTDTNATFIDARSVMSHITANGATEVSTLDQGKLHASIN